MEDVGTKKLISETQKLLDNNSRLQERSRRKNEFLIRSAENLKKVITQRETNNKEQLIQWFTQGILDMTFYEENILVDDEFSEDQNGRERLHLILDALNKPEKIIAEIYGNDKKARDVLGGEIIETVNWRRGALLYMYCCEERGKDAIWDKSHFEQCLKEGVLCLKAMLDVRSPIEEEWKDVLGNDKETYELLSKGIFSDTHVLALMYGGEMCYWFFEQSPASMEFNCQQIGQILLQKYIDLVNGPLKGKGWNSSRANELLGFLNR
ncbi:RAB7A-interacting MON1-CCZ1 complex subunit 1-like [Tubulanus polymorphus]|uniref:RAB7A-interacting MON1-CCZ1 complex subunit 1-like n=1 Tax=Tubulanus polymorphus TaxID=672921 RepID=UPI003DA55D5E